MKHKVIALLVSSMIATSGWTAPADKADRATKEEGIGLGTGAAIGAAAGGPVGFIIGAAFGGWLGDRMHDEKAGRRAAGSRHQDAETRVAALGAPSRAEGGRAPSTAIRSP